VQAPPTRKRAEARQQSARRANAADDDACDVRSGQTRQCTTPRFKTHGELGREEKDIARDVDARHVFRDAGVEAVAVDGGKQEIGFLRRVVQALVVTVPKLAAAERRERVLEEAELPADVLHRRESVKDVRESESNCEHDSREM
jgi:hypothetical protein